MKIITGFFTFAFFGVISNTRSFAQAHASFSASATIVTPVNISNTAVMNFGTLSVGTVAGGKLILAPDGTRTTTNGVTLPAATGTVSAAAFTVGGSGVYTYAITLPTVVTLTHSGGVETITAGSFTSVPSGTGTLISGKQNITVGATLSVNKGQLPGVYVSADFNVIVNYN
ncbi:MAG: YapH protein [Sediminibacterium sp.]|nr:YapH protein [Sediminibacterium sp.]